MPTSFSETAVLGGERAAVGADRRVAKKYGCKGAGDALPVTPQKLAAAAVRDAFGHFPDQIDGLEPVYPGYLARAPPWRA